MATRVDPIKPGKEAALRTISNFDCINGKPQVFFANFRGLRPGANAVQTPESGATIRVRGRGSGYFLSFLGVTQQLPGTWDGTSTTYTLPGIHKGVVWIADNSIAKSIAGL